MFFYQIKLWGTFHSLLFETYILKCICSTLIFFCQVIIDLWWALVIGQSQYLSVMEQQIQLSILQASPINNPLIIYNRKVCGFEVLSGKEKNASPIYYNPTKSIGVIAKGLTVTESILRQVIPVNIKYKLIYDREREVHVWEDPREMYELIKHYWTSSITLIFLLQQWTTSVWSTLWSIAGSRNGSGEFVNVPTELCSLLHGPYKAHVAF